MVFHCALTGLLNLSFPLFISACIFFSIFFIISLLNSHFKPWIVIIISFNCYLCFLGLQPEAYSWIPGCPWGLSVVYVIAWVRTDWGGGGMWYKNTKGCACQCLDKVTWLVEEGRKQAQRTLPKSHTAGWWLMVAGKAAQGRRLKGLAWRACKHGYLLALVRVRATWGK